MSAAGYVTVPFPGWEELETRSPDIVIVSPTASAPRIRVSSPRSDFEVSVELVLKGTNSSTVTRFLTDHELQLHQRYLVFGQYDSDVLKAFEDYRVIPLEQGFDRQSIEGKTLDQQLQILFQDGVKEMDREIQDEEAERHRLKEALRN
jgi:hypothetical protein